MNNEPRFVCGGDDENAETSSESSVAIESAKNVMKRGHYERTLSVGYPSSGTPRVDVVGGGRDVASFDAAGQDF